MNEAELKYIEIYEEFKEKFPVINKDVVDWNRSYNDEDVILLRMQNGSRFVFKSGEKYLTAVDRNI